MTSKTESQIVEVEARTSTGKNANRRLRAAGRVPGNVYGLDVAPFAVSVNPRTVEAILHTGAGRNAIFKLSLADSAESRSVMLREIQRDPATENLVHVDFVRFDPTKRIHVKVPVRLVGTPIGVKNEGGVIEFLHREVEVECLPAQIPDSLDVDISALHNNQHASVSDLQVTGDLRIIEDPETMLVLVSEPRAEEVAAVEEVEAVEGAEPELVGKEGESEEKDGDS